LVIVPSFLVLDPVYSVALPLDGRPVLSLLLPYQNWSLGVMSQSFAIAVSSASSSVSSTSSSPDCSSSSNCWWLCCPSSSTCSGSCVPGSGFSSSSSSSSIPSMFSSPVPVISSSLSSAPLPEELLSDDVLQAAVVATHYCLLEKCCKLPPCDCLQWFPYTRCRW
jgi:hypothetical protein